MNLDISNVTLPAVVVSGPSGIPKNEFVKVPETFSELYKEKLPEHFILELAACYLLMDGRSFSSIRKVKQGFIDLCEFSLLHNIQSISNFNTLIMLHFLDFMKRKHPGKRWFDFFAPLRSCLSAVLPHVVWPPTQIGWSPTLGHTPYGYESIIKALRLEIDRIRNKIGRFESAAQKGRVLKFEDIKESIGSNPSLKITSEQMNQLFLDINGPNYNRESLAGKYGIHPDTISKYKKNLLAGIEIKTKPKPLSFSKEDLIATFNYYMPTWPIEGSIYRTMYQVFQEPKGILLAEFDNKRDAENFAEKYHGFVFYTNKYSLDSQINPAQYLLANTYNLTTDLGRYLKTIKINVSELVEEYFLTLYDITCIQLYWACLTGWNLETMRSVTLSSLGFISKTEDPMEMFSPNHAIIKGYKRRGQKDDKEKEFIYISDKNDPYSLYCVLKDVFKLTQPYRRFLKGDEQDCILIAINNSTFAA